MTDMEVDMMVDMEVDKMADMMVDTEDDNVADVVVINVGHTDWAPEGRERRSQGGTKCPKPASTAAS